MRAKRSKKTLRFFKPAASKYFILSFANTFQIFLIFLLGGLFFFILKSDFFKVAFIDCQKRGFLCSGEEVDLFTEVLGKNIFFVDKNEMIKRAKFKNIQLKSVQIEKKLPDRLIVKLEEKRPLAVLSIGKDNFLVDEDGFVFSFQEEKNSGLPTLLLKGQDGISLGVEVGEKTEKALELLKVLKSFFLPSGKLVVEKDETFTLYAPEFIATFSASRDFLVQASSLQLVLSSSKISEQGKIAKIDLRFDKPVVIFK